MKTQTIERAIEALATQHGKNEAQKFAAKLRRDLGPPEMTNTEADLLSYSVPMHVNEDGPWAIPSRTSMKATKPAPKTKRPYRRSTAGRARQIAAMKACWRKKKAGKK